jgi:D-alanyl-D-alanine carboxypeptidase
MSKKKKKNDGEPLNKGRNVKVFFQSVVIIALIAAGSYTVAKIGIGISKLSPSSDIQKAQQTEATTEMTLPFQAVYQQQSNDDVYSGDLILVNNNIEYKGHGTENLVSIFDEKNELNPDGDNAFGVTDSSLMLRKNAADNLIAMLDKFYEETDNDNVVVCSGYRTSETQQELYDEDLESTGLDYSTRVALPGYSEHESGFSIDLTLYDGEYDGTGEYSWIDENCAKYGFILRYPESKTELTSIEYEPWHYRYVGVPSAEYIMKNDLCLEEYISLLKTSYQVSDDGSNILEFTSSDGKIYAIYYVAADESSDSTYVPVPTDVDFEISGNNQDGFIISFDTGRTGTPDTENNSVDETEESTLSESGTETQPEN